MAKITVQLKNWKKMNPRKDVKASSWFRLEHSLIDDPEFYDFTDAEFKAWIYIMSMASRKNSDVVVLNSDHADRASKISAASLQSAIKKLEELNILTANVTDTLRERDEEDTGPERGRHSTNERTDVTNETDGDVTHARGTRGPSKSEIISIEKKREELAAACAQSIWTALETFKAWEDQKALKSLDMVACKIVNANGGWKALAGRFADYKSNMRNNQSTYISHWTKLAKTISKE